MSEKRLAEWDVGAAVGHPYPLAMTVSAHDVAAELRKRLPGIGAKKLHKLLYYCQGHHLAMLGEALFSETVVAWDMGPVVEWLWRDEKRGHAPPAPAELSESGLNTIGYVLSRYGALTGRDLEVMTHGETPWQLADAGRQPRESARIRPEWMRDYFRTDGAPDDGIDDEPLDSAEVAAWIEAAVDRDDGADGAGDSLDDLRAWAARGS